MARALKHNTTVHKVSEQIIRGRDRMDSARNKMMDGVKGDIIRGRNRMGASPGRAASNTKGRKLPRRG